jgi:hypothetical protein
MKLKKQMRKRMMKLFKATEKGNHDSMMEAIELLIDTKGERAWEGGYKSCLDDMSVRAYRLSKYIVKRGREMGEITTEPHHYFKDDDLAMVIEEYFNDALKQE